MKLLEKKRKKERKKEIPYKNADRYILDTGIDFLDFLGTRTEAFVCSQHCLSIKCVDCPPRCHQARLLHWSCGGKPWRRIKDSVPCIIDTAYWQVLHQLHALHDG